MEAVTLLFEVLPNAAVVVNDLIDLDHAFADRDVKDANVFFHEVELTASLKAKVVAVELPGLVQVIDQEADVVQADEHVGILLSVSG